MYEIFTETSKRRCLMRISMIYSLILIGGFQLLFASNSRGQSLEEIIVMIKPADKNLEHLLKDIELQTHLTFAYLPSDVRKYNNIGLQPGKQSVKTALDKALVGTELSYRYVENSIIIFPGRDVDIRKTPELMAGERSNDISMSPSSRTAGREVVQPLSITTPLKIFERRLVRNISGRVVDSEGEPLIGVNIQVKDSSKGTATDFDGNFTLEDINENAVLVISYVGYQTQEVSIGETTNLEIIMIADSQLLDEVVVVGYGTMKKKDIVGAISEKSFEDVTDRSIVKVTDLMKGTMPGLNVTAGSGGDPAVNDEINIRGFNSINGGAPLVLVDGIEANIRTINPDDIASISILKDAQAAAIYGARGAFGVILITLKKGQSGKVGIKYSSQFSTSGNTSRTDFITDPYVFVDMIDKALGGKNNKSYVNYDEKDYEILKKVSAGEIEPYHELQSDGTYKFYYNTDFWDFYFRRWRPAQEHNLSIDGGSDKLNARLSGRVLEKTKIERQSETPFNQYNLNLNINFKPYKWLTLFGTSRYGKNYNKDTSGANDGEWSPIGYSSSALRNDFPIFPIAIDGVGVDVARNGDGYKGRTGAIMAGTTFLEREDEENVSTFGAKLEPIKDLTLNIDYSYNVNRYQRKLRQAPFEFLKGNTLTLTTGGLNRLDEEVRKGIYQALNVYTSYDFKVASKNNFNAMIGYNQEHTELNGIQVSRSDLLSRTGSNLNLGTSAYSSGGYGDDIAIMGGFGRFSYNFDDRYYLEFNSRYDGSSKFPQGSRWGFFPSVGAAWRIIKGGENWNSLYNIISSLKVRGSFGRLGNQNISSNAFRQLVSLGLLGGSAEDYYLDRDGNILLVARMPGALPANVTWEKVETKNIGLDLGLFKNRVLTSLEIYSRETKDMFVPGKALPAIFGTSAPSESYAGLINKGFELTIRYFNSYKLAGKDLSMEIGFNIANFNASMTRYDNPTNSISGLIEGRKIGEIWGYHIDGQFQTDQEAADYQNIMGETNLEQVYRDIFSNVSNQDWRKLRAGDPKFIDINGDGKLGPGAGTLDDPGDMKVIGNSMPKFPFGFNFNAEWQGISVNLIAQGVGHQDWMPTGPTYWGPLNRPFQSFYRKDLFDDFWSPENPAGKFPQVYRGEMQKEDGFELFTPSDYYLVNVGYFRINNLSIGYSIPNQVLRNLSIQNIRVYISGENMFTWSFGGLTKYIDPVEAGSAVRFSNPFNAALRSDDKRQLYPMDKTYRIGIQIEL